VVDNGSTDDSLQELAAWPRVVVDQSSTNLGFAGGANRGIARTESPVVLVLNPDVEVDILFGEQAVRLFSTNERLGVAGAKLRYPDSNLLQHAGGVLNWPLLTTMHRGHQMPDGPEWNEPTVVDFVTGGAMVLRRRAFEQVRGFDESFWPAYMEDVDLCLRLRDAGWQVRYEPSLTATHVESVTLGGSIDYFRYFHRNRLRLALKFLTAEGWWGQFIPAEIERLRGELSAVSSADWPETSGAAALEELARMSFVPRNGGNSPLSGEPLSAMIAAMDEVRERRQVVRPADARGGKGFVAGLVRRLFGRQQVFNDAVTRALEAQDRLNREISAQMLLILLDLSWREAQLQSPH
jgi:GT2 family glycosyltransferase